MARSFFQTLLDAPIAADRQKALTVLAASTRYGYVRSSQVYLKAELPQYQLDEWFCPLFGETFRRVLERNK